MVLDLHRCVQRRVTVFDVRCFVCAVPIVFILSIVCSFALLLIFVVGLFPCIVDIGLCCSLGIDFSFLRRVS